MKIDYVAKSRTETDGTLIFWHLFSAMYICYSYWIMLQVTEEDGIVTIFFFLITFLVFCMFKIMEPDMKILVEEAKKFLENTGQEETKENLNLVLNFFYSNHKWQEIEDMPYNLFEDIEIVSGNRNRKKHFL